MPPEPAVASRESLARSLPTSGSSPARVSPSAAKEPSLTVEAITRPSEIESLQPEWEALFARSPTATPFQSPAWLVPWWKHIGEGNLLSFAVRSNGRLVGFAPFYIYTRPENGRREIFPVGIATTDYLDALFEPGKGPEVCAAVFSALNDHASHWDEAVFPQLRPDSPLLTTPVPPGWKEERCESEPCPVLSLAGCGADLSRAIPPRMAHNLRYYQRRAENAGQLSFESATAENLDELFEALLRLHGARWATRGEPGVLSSENVQQAHRESLPALLSAGLLRFYALRLDGRVIAVYYGLMRSPAAPSTPRRAYYYLGGFDPEFEKLSPGTLLLGYAVREAVREGASIFDFLRGRESYKYLWGAVNSPIYRRHFTRSG